MKRSRYLSFDIVKKAKKKKNIKSQCHLENVSSNV